MRMALILLGLTIVGLAGSLANGEVTQDCNPAAANCPEKATEKYASEEGLPVLSHEVLKYSPGQHVNEYHLQQLTHAADYYLDHDGTGKIFPAIVRDLAKEQECELLTATTLLYERPETRVFYGSFTPPKQARALLPNGDRGAGLRVVRQLLVASKGSRITEEGDRRLISNIRFLDYDFKKQKLKFLAGADSMRSLVQLSPMPVQKYPKAKWLFPTHAGLSYETTNNEEDEITSISSGIYVEDGPLADAEISKTSPPSGSGPHTFRTMKSYLTVSGPYQGYFVWVTPEGCAHCHSNVRNQFSAREIEMPLPEGEGYKEFLNYLKENGVSEENRRAVELQLATPQSTLIQKGLLDVLKKEKNLRCSIDRGSYGTSVPNRARAMPGK